MSALKYTASLYCVLLSFISASLAAQEHTFSWIYVVDGYNDVYLADVAVDSSGNTYAAFNYTSNLTLPVLNKKLPYAAHVHGLLMKFDKEGKPLWAHPFKSSFDNRIKDLALAPNGDLLVTGFGDGVMNFPSTGESFNRGKAKEPGQYHYNQGIYVARYAPDGTCRWVNYLNTPWGEGLSLAVNSKDEVHLAYYFKGKLSLNNQVLDSIPRNLKIESREAILVMDGDGKFIRNHQLNDIKSSSYINRMGLKIDSNDHLLLYGTFNGSIGLTEKDTLRNISYQESIDSYIAKFDKDFRLLWSRKIGGRNAQVISAIDVDEENNVFIAGRYYFECIVGSMVEVVQQSNYEWKSGDSFFYLKLDKDGGLSFPIFQDNKGYNSHFGARSMTLDGNGHMHAIASFNDTLRVEGRELQTWHHNHQLAYMVFDQNQLRHLEMPFESAAGFTSPVSISANQFQLALGAEYHGKGAWAMINGKKKNLSFEDYGRVAFVCGGKIKQEKREEPNFEKEYFEMLQPLLACVKPGQESLPNLWFPAGDTSGTLQSFITEQPCGRAIPEMEALLYPNPTRGELTLRLNGLNEGMRMEIFSESGQLIFSQRLEAMNQTQELKMSVNNLVNGVYFLRIAGVKYQKVLRFVKL